MYVYQNFINSSLIISVRHVTFYRAVLIVRVVTF